MIWWREQFLRFKRQRKAYMFPTYYVIIQSLGHVSKCDYDIMEIFWKVVLLLFLFCLSNNHKIANVKSLWPNLGQHWLRWWLVGWRPQAITWNNVNLSVRSSGSHLRAFSLEIPQPLFTKASFKITHLKLNWNLPGANSCWSICIIVTCSGVHSSCKVDIKCNKCG